MAIDNLQHKFGSKYAADIVAALAVAILSGIFVWWLTKPPITYATVAYSKTETGRFGSGNKLKAFYRVTIFNRSKSPAIDIKLVTISLNSAKIGDYDVSTSDTRPLVTSKKERDDILSIIIPKLKPNEAVSYSVSLTGSVDPNLKISASMEDGELIEDSTTKSSKLKNNPYILFIIFISYAALSFISFKFVKQKFLNRISSRWIFKDPSNVAFAFLHAGQWERAKAILEEALRAGNSHTLTLSNYALALALDGQSLAAKNINEAAMCWDQSGGHIKDVCVFNGILIECLDGRLDRLSEIEEISARNPEVLRYCQVSKVFGDIKIKNTS